MKTRFKVVSLLRQFSVGGQRRSLAARGHREHTVPVLRARTLNCGCEYLGFVLCCYSAVAWHILTRILLQSAHQETLHPFYPLVFPVDSWVLR
jgi:hypothetical protein